MKGRVTSELRKIFRPELLNRIDETIVFHKLEREDMRHIIEIQIRRLRKQLVDREVTIEFTARPSTSSPRQATTRPSARGRCVACCSA